MSATPSTSDSTPSSTSSGDPGFASLFGNVNPIIPAALVVALLAAVISALTLWNRAVQRRVALQQGYAPRSGHWRAVDGLDGLRRLLGDASGSANTDIRSKEKPFGDKPALWDVCVPSSEKRVDEDVHWDGMLVRYDLPLNLS
jgi:hypothetical protein